MIFVNLLYFSSIHLFLFSCIFSKSVYDELASWKEKLWKPSFYFVLFVLNVIVFIYNRLKQSLILQIKPNHLLQISFCHRSLIYVYLKKYLALYVERLGYEFATMLVTFVCILYFALQICINPTRDIFLISWGKKKASKMCIYKFNYSIWQNEVFFVKFMFSEVGLKCHSKHCRQFFYENMDLSKKLVCYFASLILYICMNVWYFESRWWYTSV